MMSTGGLSSENRGYVEQLHRVFTGPFTAEDAAEALGLDSERARRLVRYLADRGWLDRVRRGLYLPVPLDSHRSGEAHQDPWVVANVVFDPAYIAGWSAAEHWDLTEQIFRDVLVVTGQRPRDRTPTIGGTRFVLHSVDPAKHFGLVPVWRSGQRIDVTDASRTVIDLLANPTWGGGIRQVAAMIADYFEGDHRDESLLVEYGERLGVGAVFKRLGFLIEELDIDAPVLVERCLERRTAGVNDLDPSIDAKGRAVSRWGIRANVRVGGVAE
ncbi:MAG: type IV toxin-antitoxin system AbiEi family antitoxin domain-containing protein [Actinomycetota bacterium]|nr:type IV toxin-antitoxin system AbiEi family antitoxin domain-containing protein [Actinomycetota bacterium]